MGPQPPRLARTLPKDFMFYSGEPRTPEQPTKEPNMPPPPNHGSCRSRRPRLDVLSAFEAKPMPFCSPDAPLPSIEVPDDESVVPPSTQPEEGIPAAPEASDHLQVPARERLDFRTPPAQILDITSHEQSDWQPTEPSREGHSITRPSSACSNVSNSSVSSCESYLSRPSAGGSCTSPESDIQDPFIIHPLSSGKEGLTPQSQPEVPRRQSLDLPNTRSWTSGMDSHLWNTYQTYLQNPTITPFKTIPGSLPPLGVSHRVAREARRTWPKVKRGPPVPMKVRKHRRMPLPQEMMSGTQKSPISIPDGDDGDDVRSGSTTPTANTPSERPWPRSNASTRRRLKELCKRKFLISPHYQRLLQSRSPSPYADRPPTGVSGPSSSGNPNPFTRDLGISLIATSVPTTSPTVAAETNMVGTSSNDWIHSNNGSSVSEAPTVAVDPAPSATATLGDSFLENRGEVPRLGSPFMYHTWGPNRVHQRLYPSTPSNPSGTMHVTGVRLRSPLPEDMYPGSHKRRALSQLEDDATPNREDFEHENDHDLPDLMCDRNKNVGQRRVRIRNRGATTGALSSRDRLNQLFTPPSQAGSGSSPDLGHLGAALAPAPSSQGPDIKRLGSPFPLTGKPRYRSGGHAPSRSESHVPTLAEPYPQPYHEDLHPLPVSMSYAASEDTVAGTGQSPAMDRHTPFH